MRASTRPLDSPWLGVNAGNDCTGGPAKPTSGPGSFGTCGMVGAAASKKVRDKGAKLTHPFEALSCVREAARANQIDITRWDPPLRGRGS